jgi:hypothetical protein
MTDRFTFGVGVSDPSSMVIIPEARPSRTAGAPVDL